MVGQYLATRGEQGYVVTDATEAIGEAALDKLRSSPQTIWLRTLRRLDAQQAERRRARRGRARRAAARTREPPAPRCPRLTAPMQTQVPEPGGRRPDHTQDDRAGRHRVRDGVLRQQGQRTDRRPGVAQADGETGGEALVARAAGAGRLGRGTSPHSPIASISPRAGDAARCRPRPGSASSSAPTPSAAATAQTRMPALAPAAVGRAGRRTGGNRGPEHQDVVEAGDHDGHDEGGEEGEELGGHGFDDSLLGVLREVTSLHGSIRIPACPSTRLSFGCSPSSRRTVHWPVRPPSSA